MRRLAIREYANVVGDLLGARAGAAVKVALPPDQLVAGFDNQSAYLFVSPSLQESVADLAATLASEAEPAAVAPCADAQGSQACLETFIRTFAAKAYGRPMSDSEFKRAMGVAALGESFAVSVRLVIELVLQAPAMLYVSELGAEGAIPAAERAIKLTPDEIASQLSFLLTGSRPDSTLLQAAERTGFGQPSDIQQEATRMLAGPAAQASLTRFLNGWLDMVPISDAYKSPDAYPQLTPAIVDAMQQEFDQFIATQLNAGDGRISTFFTASSNPVPAALEPIYAGDLGPSGLDPQHRLGVLSLPGLLTVHSNDASSGPVQRGLLVRRQLLCQQVPDPPAAALAVIAANPVDDADTTRTTRQKLDAHVTEASCRGCHATFDPIGFGLEDFDGIGRFRTTENGLPVDSRGQLTGTDVDGEFEGPAQLSTLLAKSKVVEACVVDHFFSFAQARESEPEEACVIQNWADSFAQGGGRIKDLVLSLVVHPSFANRKDDR